MSGDELLFTGDEATKRRVSLALGVLVGMLVLVTWLTLTGRLAGLDRAVMTWVYAWRSPTLTPLMNLVSLLGEQVIIAASFLLCLYLAVRARWDTLQTFLLLVAGQEVVNYTLKFLIARHRPTILTLVHETSYSFPSGHAMGSTVFYGVLALWFWRAGYGGRYRWLWFALAALITLAVGVSRIYLGAHYFSDVLAGYLAGLAWILLILTLRQTQKRERLAE